MTDIELEEAISNAHPELAEQHEASDLPIFPTLKDRVNVLTRLKLLGIKHVEVQFSGGGDSGEVEYVEAMNYNNDRVNLSNEKIEGWLNKQDFDAANHRWIGTTERVNDMPLDELLKQMTYDALEKSEHDWYNNDGGQGSLTIDFTESPPLVKLDVSINYNTTEDHEFNL